MHTNRYEKVIRFLSNLKKIAIEDIYNHDDSKEFLIFITDHYRKINSTYYDLYSHIPSVNKELMDLHLAISKLNSKINSLDI